MPLTRAGARPAPEDGGSSFEKEMLPWMRPLYGFALRLTRDPDDASDLVQESYLRALGAFSGFVPGTNAKAWLFRILYSVFANDHRRRRRRPSVALDDVQPQFERLALESWRRQKDASSYESKALLEDALSRLPEDFRAVVLLVDVEGLTYEEAAAALACPIGTVRSRLSRARRELLARMSSGGRSA
jgi:RNA polymerase sigma-70 factor (ECF subfamily)